MQTPSNAPINYVTSISALSGFILYHIRNQMGVNQREIASIFDMTHTTYGNMERGDTALNADFLYMLCTLVGIKYSDYFKLLEDLISELQIIELGIQGEMVKIQIIPSTDLQKIIVENAKHGFTIAPSIENKENLLIGQDINFFISKELRVRLSVVSQVRLTKEQIKEMISLKSSDIEETISIMKTTNLTTSSTVAALGGAAGIGAVAGSAASLVGALPLAFPLAPLIAGYGLYQAYKKTKENKKTRS
ncbi:helix-turn-helix domain-containing protein [Acinetobacter proteolyticus]|uniref:helix-turn-helix domain-containing protein n=1 Tax=Acinetobacter proteolyticus TaxID=1776741 RepID=UPI003D9883E8